MKKLALSALLSLLSGCVTYYYPAPTTSDGIYFARDDPNYVDVSASYASAAYYPWWSLDYFYLGSGYYGNSVSIGFSSGHYPYYGYWYPYYYSPYYYGWYAPYAYRPYYSHYAWHHHYWHQRYSNYHHRQHPVPHERHVNRNPGPQDEYGVRPDQRNNRGPGADTPRDYEDRGPGRPQAPGNAAPVTSRVAVTPTPGSDRSMTVRNRDGAKVGRSQLDPVATLPSQSSRVDPVRRHGASDVVSITEPGSDVVYSSRSARSASGYRFNGDSKDGRARTGPAGIPTGNIVINSSAPAAQPGLSTRVISAPATSVPYGDFQARSPDVMQVAPQRSQPLAPGQSHGQGYPAPAANAPAYSSPSMNSQPRAAPARTTPRMSAPRRAPEPATARPRDDD